ncbi:MAG: hypothetical protein HC807_02360 [Gammaproteobacteria bacterium]|nr:hypothetical protein [Gammaproteobacteria bacterium]
MVGARSVPARPYLNVVDYAAIFQDMLTYPAFDHGLIRPRTGNKNVFAVFSPVAVP